MYLHELALELKMPVREMCERMSAHELLIEWPAYLQARAELEAQQKALEGSVSPEQFDQEYVRTMSGGVS